MAESSEEQTPAPEEADETPVEQQDSLRVSVTPVVHDDEDKEDSGGEEESSGSQLDDEYADGPTEYTRRVAGSAEIKRFLVDRGCFLTNIYEALLDLGASSVADITKVIKNETQLKEFLRVVRVSRMNESRSAQTQERTKRYLNKFESWWRKETGIRKSCLTPRERKKKKRQKSEGVSLTPKDQDIEYMHNQGRALKRIMQNHDFWDVDLFETLIEHGVLTEDDFKSIKTATFIEIRRKTRVARRKREKSQQAMRRLDTKISRCEKFWRKKSGIKKTSMQAHHYG